MPNWPSESPLSYEALACTVQKRNFQVVSTDPKRSMFSFFKDFKFVQTAGGLVQRGHEDAFLWISRFEHLDLPKGKIEKGEGVYEAALREIQEETGLTGQFELREQLPNTYHVYPFKNRSVFKENHWFCFYFFGEAALNPQTEEGIEAVFWLTDQQWRSRLEQTYPGLKELLETAC